MNQQHKIYLDWRVRQSGRTIRMQPIPTRRHIKSFGRVVERPLEAFWGRVSVNLTHNVSGLVTCHSIDTLLVGATDWFICKEKNESKNYYNDKQTDAAVLQSVVESYC